MTTLEELEEYDTIRTLYITTYVYICIPVPYYVHTCALCTVHRERDAALYL